MNKTEKTGKEVALEIFDRAIQKILEQGEPSIENGVQGCLYRGPEGRKCGAGHFIPDEKYNVEMEGKKFGMVNFMWNLGYTQDEENGLRAAQIVHDAAAIEGFDAPDMAVYNTNKLYFGKEFVKRVNDFVGFHRKALIATYETAVV